jgi:hypothetical protein
MLVRNVSISQSKPRYVKIGFRFGKPIQSYMIGRKTPSTISHETQFTTARGSTEGRWNVALIIHRLLSMFEPLEPTSMGVPLALIRGNSVEILGCEHGNVVRSW